MTDGEKVFAALRSILLPFAKDLVVVHDTKAVYYLDTKRIMPNKKPLFFGAARTGKSYVSFYLMPIYAHPELCEGMSPELSARMQGKSCFNFKREEPALFRELGSLTKQSFARWKKDKMLA